MQDLNETTEQLYLNSGENKETALEGADFTLQLLMFVTDGKAREMFIIFFLSAFCQLSILSWERMSPGHDSPDQPA